MIKYLVVRHKVIDYDLWKKAFDEHADVRHDYGLGGGEICRDIDDPLLLTIAVKYDDLDRVKEFLRSDYVKEAMTKAGVIDEPTLFFLEQVAVVPELVSSHSEKG